MTDRQLLERLVTVREQLHVIVTSYFEASSHSEWESLYLEAISTKAKADELYREAYLRGLMPDSLYIN